MANGTSDPLLERAKFFREHVQTILNLATGSFVLSVTFLHNIVPKPQSTDFLKRSWFLFVGTLLLGLTYNYVLSIYVRSEGKNYGKFLSRVSLLFHLSFVIGLYYFLRFGIANL